MIQIPLFLLLFSTGEIIGKRYGIFVQWLASMLVISAIVSVWALTPRLLAKGWFPWMIKSRGKSHVG